MNRQVKLLHETPLYLCVLAARTCYDSVDKSDTILTGDHRLDVNLLGPKDADFLKRIVKDEHESILEHKVYTFLIKGFSRAVLQELARHRMASISVRSTRYTLNKIIKKGLSDTDLIGARVQTDPDLDELEKSYLKELLALVIKKKIPADKFKHKIPESLKFECIWTINARSLRNFLQLRLSTSAMWEIRILAAMVYDSLNTWERGLLFPECGSQAAEILGVRKNVTD